MHMARARKCRSHRFRPVLVTSRWILKFPLQPVHYTQRSHFLRFYWRCKRPSQQCILSCHCTPLRPRSSFRIHSRPSPPFTCLVRAHQSPTPNGDFAAGMQPHLLF